MNSRRRRALITRPKEDASEVAIALVRRRITPLIEPMMRIEYTTLNIDAKVATAQALLFTSRNGVRAFSRVSEQRGMPVFAVGDSTAALASDNGFTDVKNAGGDNIALAKLVIDQLSPSEGPLLHVAGASVAGPLSETLIKTGFEVVRIALYEAKPSRAFSNKTANAVRNNEIDYVLFFSPRTAKIFAEHIVSNKLEDDCHDLLAVCLSDSVAQELAGFVWKELAVAKAPNLPSIMETIEAFENRIASPDDTTPPRSNKFSSSVLGSSGLGERAEARTAWSLDTPAVDPDSFAEENTQKRQETQMVDASTGGPVSSPTPNPPYPRHGVSWVVWALAFVLLAIPISYLTLPYWNKFLPDHVRERFTVSPQVNATDLKTIQIIEGLRQDNSALRMRITELASGLGDAQAKLNENAALALRMRASEKLLAGLKTAQVKAMSLVAKGTENSEKLATRVEKLEKSIEKSDPIPGGEKVEPGRIDSKTAAMISRLETTILDFSGRIVDLERQLSSVRRGYSGTDNTSAVVLAIDRLRDALSGSDPFARQLTKLRHLAGQNPIIVSILTPIESLSAAGVPTSASLFADLPTAIDGIVATTRTPREGDWVDRVVQRLQSFVRVRRVDGKGVGTEAQIARTEMAARRGDLAGAVRQIAKLRGAAAIAAKDWVVAAQARIVLNKSITSLNTATRSLLTAGAEP
ncbi:MAG: uroporphyrinogen-III synthase [Pseudomonadota bacterium]|nr:uroporphyrinogen-III synthase [Pseudomonadota bacterium]